jgi:hypothetical protein
MKTAATADAHGRPTSALPMAAYAAVPRAPTAATGSSARSGAYDENAKAAAETPAPSAIIDASASPMVPALTRPSSNPTSSPTVSPMLTPAMIPAVRRIASIIRADAVSGKPVSASWVAPMRPIPASSMTIPAVTTCDGFTSKPVASAATASNVAIAPPATCW